VLYIITLLIHEDRFKRIQDFMDSILRGSIARMIGALSGKVIGTRGGHVIIDCGGVGYLVSVRSVFDFTEGGSVTLHTHLAVRENALDLYGFLLIEELRMFEELIKLPKIGPKSAMQVLMQADVATLKHAIGTGDPVYLSKMSGIGKKTAEKIVAELKDTFGEEAFTASISREDTDVMDALLALGYAHKDIREALAKIPPSFTDTKKRITEALKIVSS
jgi:holliday junction DNA helicase RuvA